jgi:GTP-binding protein HflX
VHTIDFPPPEEKVILSGLMLPGADVAIFEEDMQEMVQLCRTAGASVERTIVQRRGKPNASTYLGSGKIKEIHDAMIEAGCKTLIVDADLSPGQIRSIEAAIEGKVIDRSQLILDIFASHARTNEARIQVELAQMRTLYPRLTHAWSHFSQQMGGIGTKGPGEKQLEVDRRLVQKKISDLKDRLKQIEKSRVTQRKSREETFKATLVGYTNVGKSSLLNALCGSDLLVENKLFATLDTATRRVFIPSAGTIAISDTVGLIRKLPHHLVASFRSTLEVVSDADLILIVLDASSPWSACHLSTTEEVLASLDAQNIPRLIVFNKSDLIVDTFAEENLPKDYPNAVFVSALARTDMDMLKNRIADIVTARRLQKQQDTIIAHESALAEESQTYQNDDQ